MKAASRNGPFSVSLPNSYYFALIGLAVVLRNSATRLRRSHIGIFHAALGLGLSTMSVAPVLSKEISLFNGKNLKGWTAFLTDPGKKMEEVWSVKDGVLICKGLPMGYIRTEKDFTSFVLTLEWRFDPAKGAGNSGVLMRLQAPDKVWPKSIEAQLHSENAGDIWNIDEFKIKTAPERTDGRHTTKLHPTNEKPLGEWNKYEITFDKGILTLKVNGLVQNVATDCEILPGKIALQSEGAEIHFRNIKIRELK